MSSTTSGKQRFLSDRVPLVSWYYNRCGCYCVSGSGVCKRSLIPVDTGNSEEREQLQEPLDQISLSSIDSVESDDDIETKI